MRALQAIDPNRLQLDSFSFLAMICSMTPQERRMPVILNARRRRRIAAGSGTTVAALNGLLKRFAQMQKMMKKMGKFQKMMAKMGGGMGAMPGMGKLLGR